MMELAELEALLRTHLDDIYKSTGKKFYIDMFSDEILVTDGILSFQSSIKDENGAKEFLKKVYASLEEELATKDLIDTRQEQKEIEERELKYSHEKLSHNCLLEYANIWQTL